MGKTTGIDWATHTWNPWQGCTPVSEGCRYCYMYREKRRYGQDPARIVRSPHATFSAPKARYGARSTKGTPGEYRWPSGGRVFVCSWSDFCHPDVAPAWRREAWGVIRQRPGLTFLILTKRVGLLRLCLPEDWGRGWPNVWLGVTAENQRMWDRRVPTLARIPAVVRFVSVEPMLSPVYPWLPSGQRIDWVIAGCESGPQRRICDPDWIRELRDGCLRANTPFFLKQMEIGGHLVRMPALAGREWDQVPTGSVGLFPGGSVASAARPGGRQLPLFGGDDE